MSHRMWIFNALKVPQNQTASVMEKLKITQRSKCMQDEKFVQELFEEIIHGGSKDYVLACADIMIKGKWKRQDITVLNLLVLRVFTGVALFFFNSMYNDTLDLIILQPSKHLTRSPVRVLPLNFNSTEAQKTSWGNFLMTWTCGTDFLSGSFYSVHLDVSSIKDQAVALWRTSSLLGWLWTAQQDAAGITSIVPGSVQKQKNLPVLSAWWWGGTTTSLFTVCHRETGCKHCFFLTCRVAFRCLWLYNIKQQRWSTVTVVCVRDKEMIMLFRGLMQCDNQLCWTKKSSGAPSFIPGLTQ